MLIQDAKNTDTLGDLGNSDGTGSNSMPSEPPSYLQAVASTNTISITTSDTGSASVSGTTIRADPIIPTPLNYIEISNSKPIRGKWNINPALVIPTLLLPLTSPIVEEGTNQIRPNLRLYTRDGNISADVWISEPIASSGVDNKATAKDTVLDVMTKDGNVSLRVVSIFHFVY